MLIALLCTLSLFVYSADKEPVKKQAPIVVSVGKVEKKDLPQYLHALGTLNAIDVVTISSVTDGRISNIEFKNGQAVEKGMPIVLLDNQQVVANYETAKTNLDLANKKYSRSTKLGDAISHQDLEALKADVAVKKADLMSKEAAMNEKKVLAPFSGVLGSFKVNVGDFVSAGDPLVTLVNNESLRADYNIPESEVTKIQKNQMVVVSVSAFPKELFYGTVNYISPTIDKSTRTVTVQALVPNKTKHLKAGMFVQLKQQFDVKKDVLVVPDDSVMADVKGYYVFKVDDSSVSQVYVKLGERTSGYAQINSGLQEGDAIVVTGQQKLQDGSEITTKDVGSSK